MCERAWLLRIWTCEGCMCECPCTWYRQRRQRRSLGKLSGFDLATDPRTKSKWNFYEVKPRVSRIFQDQGTEWYPFIDTFLSPSSLILVPFSFSTMNFTPRVLRGIVQIYRSREKGSWKTNSRRQVYSLFTKRTPVQNFIILMCIIL